MKQLANPAPVTQPTRWFIGVEIRWGMRSLRKGVHRACRVLAAMVLVALPAAAQLEMGDNLRMNLNGNLGYNYASTIDQGETSHGNGFAGNANLAGNYYSPNFLSFNVAPFYNRSQSDSLFGSLTNTSGVGAGVNLFNGSHFPGSISYNRLYNDTGAYGIPGSDIGLATHANTQSFGAGWSALVPNWPTFTANYIMNGTGNSILGEEGSNSENDKMLMLISTYRIDGWNFNGQFTHRNTDTSLANFADPEEGNTHSSGATNTFTATAQHSLPFTGNFSTNFQHVGYSYQFDENSDPERSSTGSNSVNANAGFHPTAKFGMSFGASYNDNLLGEIPQPVLNTGTPLDLKSLGSFQSVLVGGDAYYQVLNNLGVHANVTHTYQSFLGETYSATQFGGSANFNFGHSILKGLSFSFGVVDTAQQQYNTGLGFVGSLNYNRKFAGWDVSGNFMYSQNVATALLVYMSSSYSYLASVRRRLNDRSQFMVGYSGSHSGITNSGASSAAERVFTTLFYRTYNLNAFYSKSDGEAIFTATGLVPITTILPPQVLTGSEFTQYRSTGWGVGGGATPLRRLVVSAAFAKSIGSTIDPVLSSYTNNTLISTMVQYRMRKINLNGGYTRLSQNLGVTGATPVMVTSYYIGLSRWFNFF